MAEIMTCPHCKRESKLIPLRDKPERRNGRTSEFENSQEMIPPQGWLSSLVWFMRGKTTYLPEEPRENDVTIRIEAWDKNSARFDFMDSRIDVSIVKELAVMVDSGHKWTRENITKYTSLRENTTRLYYKEFKRLDFLEVSDGNVSTLTPSGRRFLRGVARL